MKPYTWKLLWTFHKVVSNEHAFVKTHHLLPYSQAQYTATNIFNMSDLFFIFLNVEFKIQAKKITIPASTHWFICKFISSTRQFPAFVYLPDLTSTTDYYFITMDDIKMVYNSSFYFWRQKSMLPVVWMIGWWHGLCDSSVLTCSV